MGSVVAHAAQAAVGSRGRWGPHAMWPQPRVAKYDANGPTTRTSQTKHEGDKDVRRRQVKGVMAGVCASADGPGGTRSYSSTASAERRQTGHVRVSMDEKPVFRMQVTQKAWWQTAGMHK